VRAEEKQKEKSRRRFSERAYADALGVATGVWKLVKGKDCRNAWAWGLGWMQEQRLVELCMDPA